MTTQTSPAIPVDTDPVSKSYHPSKLPAAVLSQRALLVDLTISIYRFRKQDRRVITDVAATNKSNADLVNVSKRLLGKDYTGAIFSAVNAMNIEHKLRTLPWGRRNGNRVLLTSAYRSYFEAMRKHQDTIEREFNAFVARYDEAINAAQQEQSGLGLMFDRSEYPSSEELTRKFSVSIDIQPIPAEGDFRMSLNQDEIERLRRIYAEDLISDVCGAAESDVAQRILATLGPKDEGIIARLQRYDGRSGNEKGDRSGYFTDSIVSSAQKLAEMLPGLNLTDNPAFSEIADKIKADVCRFTPDELRASAPARKMVEQACDEILDSLSELIA